MKHTVYIKHLSNSSDAISVISELSKNVNAEELVFDFSQLSFAKTIATALVAREMRWVVANRKSKDLNTFCQDIFISKYFFFSNNKRDELSLIFIFISFYKYYFLSSLILKNSTKFIKGITIVGIPLKEVLDITYALIIFERVVAPFNLSIFSNTFS